jgi:hypothetical protein
MNVNKPVSFNRNVVRTPKVESGSMSFLSSMVMFLLFVFMIILIVFLVKYLVTECGPEGKKNFVSYVTEMDFNATCKPPLPEIKYEEREEKREDEVFAITDQLYTHNEAKEKCKAYDSELATYQQIVKYYNDNGYWGPYYAWAKDGAYYPMQPCEFVKLRRKGQMVGPPGVNGGKFRSKIRFGAACYGVKPPGEVVIPKTPFCKGETDVCRRNPDSCKRLDSDRIGDFNVNKKWSQWDN